MNLYIVLPKLSTSYADATGVCQAANGLPFLHAFPLMHAVVKDRTGGHIAITIIQSLSYRVEAFLFLFFLSLI